MKKQLFFLAFFYFSASIFSLKGQTGSLLWHQPGSSLRIDGASWSTPVIMNNKLYWQCQDGGMACLDAQTGTILWMDSVGFGNTYHHPVGYEGNIFTQSADSFCAVNGSNGRLLWSRNDVNAIPSGTPLKEHKIYVPASDGIYCLNTNDGTTIWSRTILPNSLLISFDGTELIAASSHDTAIYALDLTNGNTIWKRVLPNPDPNFGSMAVSEDTLVVVPGEHSFAGGEVIYALELSTRNILWQKSGLGYCAMYSPPAIESNKLFISSRTAYGTLAQRVYALKLNDGSVIWNDSCRYGAAGRTPFLTVLDGKVFYDNEYPPNPATYICADISTGDAIWATYPTNSSMTWGQLLIYDNKLYGVRDMDGIFCYDAGIIHGDWTMFRRNSYQTGTLDSIITEGIKDTPSVSTDVSLSVYPNPFSNSTTIRISSFSGLQLKYTELEIVDMLGRVVQRIKPEKQITGFERNALPGGVYFIRFTLDRKLIATDKMIITD